MLKSKTFKKIALIEQTLGKPIQDILVELNQLYGSIEGTRKALLKAMEDAGVKISLSYDGFLAIVQHYGIDLIKETKEQRVQRFKKYLHDAWKDPEYRQKKSEEHRERAKKQWESGNLSSDVIWTEERKEEHSKFMSEFNKKLWQDPEYQEKQSQKAKKQWEDPEFREYVSNKAKERMSLDEYIKLYREVMKKNWENEDFRKLVTEAVSESNKKRWNDPEFSEELIKILSSLYSRPTKPELMVEDILKDLNVTYEKQPFIRFETRWVQPDFKVGNLIIEVQGDYWHANPEIYDYDQLNDVQKSVIENDREKDRLYKEHGYKVLYVWEKELKDDLYLVRKKIAEFLKEGGLDVH